MTKSFVKKERVILILSSIFSEDSPCKIPEHFITAGKFKFPPKFHRNDLPIWPTSVVGSVLTIDQSFLFRMINTGMASNKRASRWAVLSRGEVVSLEFVAHVSIVPLAIRRRAPVQLATKASGVGVANCASAQIYTCYVWRWRYNAIYAIVICRSPSANHTAHRRSQWAVENLARNVKNVRVFENLYYHGGFFFSKLWEMWQFLDKATYI